MKILKFWEYFVKTETRSGSGFQKIGLPGCTYFEPVLPGFRAVSSRCDIALIHSTYFVSLVYEKFDNI